MSRRAMWGMLLGFVLAARGCDDKSPVPDALLKAHEEAATLPDELPRPTTQELLEGPRVGIVLDTLPVRMQVPPHWRITRHGTAGKIVWLEGPTPHGDARIDLKYRDAIPPAQYDAYLRESRRDREKEPNTEIEMRSAGPMQIVSRRSFLPPVTAPVVDAQGMPKLDAKGDVLMQTAVPMRWWLNMFVPFGDRVEQYDLSFVLITRDQFEADKAILEQMLSTLQYIGPAPATAPAAAPAGR